LQRSKWLNGYSKPKQSRQNWTWHKGILVLVEGDRQLR
jgi:hypothetical protein